MADENITTNAHAEEIAALKRQMEEMQKRLEELGAASQGASGRAEDAADSEPLSHGAPGETGEEDRSEPIDDAACLEGDVSGAHEPAEQAVSEPENSAEGDQGSVEVEPVDVDFDAPEAAEPISTDAASSAGSSAESPAAAPVDFAPYVPPEGEILEAEVSDQPETAVRVEPVEPPDATAPIADPAQAEADSRPSFDQSQGVSGSPVPPPEYTQQAYASGQQVSADQAQAAPGPQQAYAQGAYAQYGQAQAGQYAQPQQPGQQAQNPYGGTYAGQQVPFGQAAGQQQYQQPQQPYGYGYGYGAQQGGYQQPVVRTKDHVAAGLLGIFLGMFGIHKFYLGYNTAGFIMLGVTIIGGLVTFGLAASVVWLIGLIEGVIYLIKNQVEFEQAYVFKKREWF